MFVIEVPDTDKVDVEISSNITGTYINKQKDYHPIYSRQRVLTKDWERGEQYAWPNRKSISKKLLKSLKKGCVLFCFIK